MTSSHLDSSEAVGSPLRPRNDIALLKYSFKTYVVSFAAFQTFLFAKVAAID